MRQALHRIIGGPGDGCGDGDGSIKVPMVCGGWGTPDFPLRFVSSRDRIRMFGWMDVRGGGGGGVIIPDRAWHLVLPHDEGKGWDGMGWDGGVEWLDRRMA